MKRMSSLVAVPLAAAALLSASIIVAPVPDAAAQATPAPKPTTAPAAPQPAAKPAGAATAPRAGGIPLELAGGLVAGGSALIGGGLYALRRHKKPS
jgi:hypothetical protein